MTKRQSKSAREIALKVLYDIEKRGAFSSIALDRRLNKYELDRRDKDFITEIVHGVLRTQGTLDWVIESVANRNMEKTPAWIRLILRMGVYQIRFMDKVPNAAAVNECVELSKIYGHPGTVRFVNGVLRAIIRKGEEFTFPDISEDPVLHISLRYSHPEWMVARWIELFGVEETIELCKANNKVPVTCIRTNYLKTNTSELKALLVQEGIKVEEGRYAKEALYIKDHGDIGTLESFQRGLFQVQGESSIVVGHVLNPQPGDFVIDVCGGPGGKTTHIAELMDNKGKVISCDLHLHKLKLVDDSCKRLSIDIVETLHCDGRDIWRRFNNEADRVLVDAPCSGLGVLAKRSDSRWRQNPHEAYELHELQVQLLLSASKCVKPGGIMVYSTCTIEPKENQATVEEFLKKEHGFRLVHGSIPLKRDGKALIRGPEGFVEFFPHIHGTDGFFIACMQKL